MSSRPTYDQDVLSILPIVQPKWKRSVTSNDVQPCVIKDSGGDICGVCRHHESRYTCPRCAIPYCSVACYKEHDVNGVSCTEAFYQERVSTVLQLDAKERSGSMKKILQRYNHVLSEEEGCNQEDASAGELWRLAEALEKGSIVDEDTDKLLSPEMRLAFERAVKSGELSNIIEPWHPWWIPEFVSEQSFEQSISGKARPTLDERLLKVPHFSSLRPDGPLPLLAYNAVDLLYSVALTLRLYNGVENAVALCQEAATTLFRASAVLREDARHTTLAEALMACTSGFMHGEEGGNTHWTVLARDVVYLCSARHMSHALLDATDIASAASKAMKEKGEVENAFQIHRMKKKLKFYLSWSREATLPGDLEVEIRTWIDEWKGLNEPDTLWLPTTGDQRCGCSNTKEGASEKTSGSLLMEIISKKMARKSKEPPF